MIYNSQDIPTIVILTEASDVIRPFFKIEEVNGATLI
jgi:hypothetical protein